MREPVRMPMYKFEPAENTSPMTRAAFRQAVEYACLKLFEAGFSSVTIVAPPDVKACLKIRRTHPREGHSILESIWDKCVEYVLAQKDV